MTDEEGLDSAIWQLLLDRIETTKQSSSEADQLSNRHQINLASVAMAR